MATLPLFLLLLLLLLLSPLFLHHISSESDSITSSSKDKDLEDDINFLLEQDPIPEPHSSSYSSDRRTDLDEEDSYDSDQYNTHHYGSEGAGEEWMTRVDDKDVLVLIERNFTTVIENNQHVMVEFYAPWCGHCQSLAPDYAAAATALKHENVLLAKVDATVEDHLAHDYDVQGFPTIIFFVDGDHIPYTGQRTKEAIVTWISKRIGHIVENLTTVNDAKLILSSGNKVVLGFFDSLVGPESVEFTAASKLEDDVKFYQTVDDEVAVLFHIDPKKSRPALVFLKNETEKQSHFDGKFVRSEILKFVSLNKIPLVTLFTKESAQSIFDNPVKKQLLLFSTSKNTESLLPPFEEAAQFFKGELIFVNVDTTNKEFGKPVADYFGVRGDGPKIVAYSGNEDGRKFLFDGQINVDEIKIFASDFLNDKLLPFVKSDPIPESNDGDVKIVVGDNFDKIVLDESKDVLLEIYAPWCGHCQAMEPSYHKLAKYVRGIESLVIAKMDGTSNEHPRGKSDGYPTILFFPAGRKSFDPVSFEEGDRSVVGLYRFIKKHATTQFKLNKGEKTDGKESMGGDKDEL